MGNNRLGLRLKGTQSPVAKHTALENTKSAIGRFSEGGLHEKIASLWGKCVLWHPIARATSYCLLPDTLCLRASKNVFKVGSVKFANSLSPPSIVKKVRTGSKSSQGT